MLGPNKCLVEKIIVHKKMFKSPKKCWVQIYVRSKIFLGLEKYWYQIYVKIDFYPKLFDATEWSPTVLESPCCL